MNVPGFEFLLFAIVGAIIFNFAGRGLASRLVMLALNLVFFATFVQGTSTIGGWMSILPYLGFLAVGYAGTLVLRRPHARWVFAAFIAVVIAAFFWLKRYTFVPEEFSLTFLYMTIGLSYVFFRVLHLIIDVGQGAIEERISPLSYLNYTLNFPALVSGPIQFYQDYKKAEADRLPIDLIALGGAGERIISGLFKVLVISALLQNWQNALIAGLDESAGLSRIIEIALIGAIYPLFLYANFSGYTDFVIGAARLFRFKLPENFDNPFAAENFINFWSRWHITLSNWLKTYVYTPLLMTLMRRMPSAKLEPWFAVIAYFVTFFLVGAWHGQTAEFLFFGVLQGAGVAGNKLWQIAMQGALTRKGYRSLAGNWLYRTASRGLTFTYFAFTLLWFWSNWAQIGELATLEGLGGFALGWLMVWAAATVALALLVALQEAARNVKIDGEGAFASRYVRTAAATAMAAITLTSVVLLNAPAPDIVYKNF